VRTGSVMFATVPTVGRPSFYITDAEYLEGD
jgi:hypothetical protein